MQRLKLGESSLIQQIETTSNELQQQLAQWSQQQSHLVRINTRIPVDLYSSVYEGAPRRYLSGVAIAGINQEDVRHLINSLKGSKARAFFEDWYEEYEQYPDLSDPDNLMLVTESGLRFENRSVSFKAMRVGDLMQLHNFLVNVCGNLQALTKHLSAPRPPKTVPKPSYPRRLMRIGKVATLNAAMRVTHSH